MLLMKNGENWEDFNEEGLKVREKWELLVEMKNFEFLDERGIF